MPVQVQAAVAGVVDDFNRFTLQGSTGAVELRDWFGLQQRQGDGPWQPQGDAAAQRLRGQADQLDQWVALIEGRPHTLPGFAEALAVQDTIEALLAGTPTAA